MNKKQLESVEWEQESYDIPNALEYFVGLNGPSIENVKHPDNLWTILDRMHTIVLDDEELLNGQKMFLHHFLEKWMKDIMPYCVRLESE